MRISDWSSDVCSSDLDFRPGSPDGRRPRLPSYRIADENSIDINAILGVGEPTVAEAGEPVSETTGVMRGDTCHIDVVDRWGNMVAATPSGGWFQSSPVVPGLGFSLSTRAQMRSEEHPSELHSLMRISYAVFCLQ